MVILHGSNMDGLMMVQYFGWLADKYRWVDDTRLMHWTMLTCR